MYHSGADLGGGDPPQQKKTHNISEKNVLLQSRWGMIIQGGVEVTEFKSTLSHRHKIESDLMKRLQFYWYQ